MTRRLWIGAAVVILSNALMITFMTFDTLGRFLLVSSVIFVAVALACRRDVRRIPLVMIVIITAAVQLPGLFSYPLTSDDAYRYVWDGRVQLAGIDPYRYVPLDPALAGLRDPQLFPPDEPPVINRPGVPTLYPPIAQLWFAFWALVTPWAWDSLGVQVGAALAVVATTVVAGPLPAGTARLGSALRRVPRGGGRGGERSARGCARGAMCGGARLGGGPPPALAGRAVPRSGCGNQAGAAAARPGVPAARPLADVGGRRSRCWSRAISRTCWPSARWCSASCRATGARRGTTGRAASHC